MATITRLEDLECWKMARTLTQSVYECSKTGTFSRDFALRDQIRRAAVSVMSNIAEGFERSGNAEFAQFLAMAKGSAGEAESHLQVALDQSYLTREQFALLRDLAPSTKRLIAGFMQYLRRCDLRGVKYKPASHQKPQTKN